jgi:hypothetical protein
VRRVGSFALLVAVLHLTAGCSDKSEEPVEARYIVRGKVTYDGQPAPYGFVQFYTLKKSLDTKTGSFVPACTAEIHNGSYEASVPPGAVMICVVADPDEDPATVMMPAGAKGNLHNPAGKFQKPPPKGVKPSSGPPEPKKAGDPKKGEALPDPKEAGGPVIHFNPMTAKMTDEQKDVLRKIHAKYGDFGKSPLAYEVKVGDQTHDLLLTTTGKK